MRLGIATAAAALGLGASALPSNALAQLTPPSCTVASGTLTLAVGTSGFTEGIAVIRSGDQVQVLVDSFEPPETGPLPIQCSGGTPTVTSIDLIKVIGTPELPALVDISLAGGPFAPGASPEPDGSPEIEIDVEQVFSVNVVGSEGSDGVSVGELDGLGAANLNAGTEASPDADLLARPLTVPGRKRTRSPDIEVHTMGGADTITIGGPLFSGPPQDETEVDGGDGDDTLVGSKRTDQLNGGDGNDVLLGLGGHDSLAGRDGADLLDSGALGDFVIGGAGEDRIRSGGGRDFVTSGSGRDRVHCGGSKDLVNRGPARNDRLKGCEVKVDFSEIFH
jgi:hypothetical protein